MSSQRDAGIPVFHAPDGIGYRLMELPPELLEALESPNPPKLSLEASATSAVLKCGSQAWGLRQKNTSNALILFRPGDINLAPSQTPQTQQTQQTQQTPQTPQTPQIPQAQSSLRLISTIHDTIELVPESTDKPVPPTKGKWHERFARGR
ncbi:hypothetical protein F4859DRAFT_511130 [Xylaria cf. heliscus]|nr:hypothetical protein F4859DRAFT_511130 [Xylaria cf. heliscus]